MSLRLLYSLLPLMLEVSPAHLGTTTLLQIQDGQIRGDLETSIRGATPYGIFYGVPYAKPPVGPRRFKAPELVEPWEGVFDNRQSIKSICIQNGAYFFQHATEDCLYLNVATPSVRNGQIDSNASLPVMVWIHGGGWTSGSDQAFIYNPDFFMDHGVVYVGVNYRLSALGFFALENQAFGNQGLRDQTMALHWVQRNIRHLGGNPDSVTIFGESAGSWSAFYHTLSPLSNGLFHRAIAQSGAKLGPSLKNSPKTQEKAFKMGLDLAANAGCFPTEDDPQNVILMECLQNIEDGFDILRADNYSSTYANIDQVLGEDSFLPEFPRDILESGSMNNVDLIIGVNKDEGLINIYEGLRDPMNDTIYATIRENWETYGPSQLFGEHADEVTEEAVGYSNDAAVFYLSGGIENYNYDHLQGIVNMYSDASFWYTTDEWARLAEQNGITTYKYILSQEVLFGFLLLSGIPNSGDYGVCHGDEVTLLFGGTINSVMPAGDKAVSENMVRWWTNFAKYGNPTPASEDPEVIWESLSESGKYLVINRTSYMDLSDEYNERMQFWRNICGTDGCHFGSTLVK